MTAVTTPTFTKQKDYWAVGLTHFCADALTSGRNLVVAVLALSLGLTNSQVAIAALLYNIGNALSQPLFGLLADKVGPRLLVVGGIAWMIFFGTISALAGEWPALIAITVMGLGSGAFHPAGTMVASQVNANQRTRATALFFVMGQMGLFAGPILAGLFMDVWSRPGYVAMSLIAAVAFAGSWQWVVNRWEMIEAQRTERATIETATESRTIAYVLPLLLTIVSYSTISMTVMTFMPKLFAERQFDISYVGWLTGIFMFGMAIGGYLGGMLGDRFNGRLVIIGSMTAAIAPLYFAIVAPPIWQMVLLALAGLTGGMPHSILVLTVQNIFPGRRALASGLALGSMFFGGSIGSYIIGVVADNIGLAPALQGMALLPLIAAVMTLVLFIQEKKPA